MDICNSITNIITADFTSQSMRANSSIFMTHFKDEIHENVEAFLRLFACGAHLLHRHAHFAVQYICERNIGERKNGWGSIKGEREKAGVIIAF